MRLFLVLTCSSALISMAACVPTNEVYLYKPGASVARADSDLFDCRINAARMVPTDTQIATTPRYTTPVQTQCYNIGYSVQCHSTGGQTYGGNTYSYDANQDLRARYLAQCLASKGYSATEIPACDAKKVPAGTLEMLRGKQRAPSENACYVPITEGVGNVVYASELVK